MISDADLAGMRQTLDDSLPETAYILRRQKSADGAGGQTQTYPAPGDPGVPTVACRLTIQSDTERKSEDITAGRVTGTTIWIGTLPALTDIALVDRLAIGSRTFEVALVVGPTTWEIDRRVLLREIT